MVIGYDTFVKKIPMKFYVLITDDTDDYFLLKQAFDGLDHSPFELKHLTDGIELLEFLFRLLETKQNLPDLIILDYNMPRMNGLEVLKSIKQMEKLSGIPIVIYTTMNNSEQMNELLENGATACVTKYTSLKQISLFVKQVHEFLYDHQEISENLIFIEDRQM
jgi:CheY-like chemotaxis protein